MIKFKVGNYYRVNDKNDPTDWDISRVTKINKNLVTFDIVKRSDGCYVESPYVIDINYALKDIKVKSLTCYKTKLGKILYGSK